MIVTYVCETVWLKCIQTASSYTGKILQDEDIRHTASYLVTKGTRAPTRGSVDPSDESFFIEDCLYSSSLPL